MPKDQLDLDNVESLKVMVIGDAAVGKTCMLISYSNNEFPQSYVPTVFDNYTANVVFEGKTVALGLWDTAGTSEYDTLRPLSYPDTHMFIIVFSVDSQESLINVEKKWYTEIQDNTEGVPFIVVGNKVDIRKERNDQCVDVEEAERIAKKIGASSFIECSAKTQENLKLVFEECIRVVYEAYSTKIKKGKKGGNKKDCILS